VEATTSPLVERKMTLAGVIAESFPKAEQYLLSLADLKIDAQRIRRVTRRFGKERVALRERLTRCFFEMPIPDQLLRAPDGIQAPEIAVVMLDGGRLQVLSRGSHQSRRNDSSGRRRKKGEHWRESRIGLVLSMTGPAHMSDPMPQLPDFLGGGVDLEKKFSEMSHLIGLPEMCGESASETLAESTKSTMQKSARRSRGKELPPEQRALPGPTIVSRDCIASRDCWKEFGRTMAAEAWIKGFASAKRKACVCDGSDAIRGVAETHFSDYVLILDLMHALGYAMNASRGIGGSHEAIRSRYRGWAELIWNARVADVIKQLDGHQKEIGDPPPDAASDDPREAIRRTRVYYTNQKSRMNYPAYRLEGFPLTSSLMESAVKQVGRRVKGTEKFWSAAGGDQLLALRGDAVSDGSRLDQFLRQFSQPTTGMRDYAIAT
jgi:hypothetical protein